MGLVMTKPMRQHQPPTLSPEQARCVRTACSVLRHTARDRFLQDLACELAKRRTPLSDADVQAAISDLLGLVAVKNFVIRGD
jgi:hypothetical protein